MVYSRGATCIAVRLPTVAVRFLLGDVYHESHEETRDNAPPFSVECTLSFLWASLYCALALSRSSLTRSKSSSNCSTRASSRMRSSWSSRRESTSPGVCLLGHIVRICDWNPVVPLCRSFHILSAQHINQQDHWLPEPPETTRLRITNSGSSRGLSRKGGEIPFDASTREDGLVHGSVTRWTRLVLPSDALPGTGRRGVCSFPSPHLCPC